MFEEIAAYAKIRAHQIVGDNLYLLSGLDKEKKQLKRIQLGDASEEIFFQEELAPVNFSVHGNKVYLVFPDHTLVVNTQDKKTVKWLGKMIHHPLGDDDIICDQREGVWQLLSRYAGKEQQVVWQLDHSSHEILVVGETVFYIVTGTADRSIVRAVAVEDGSIRWNLDVGEVGKFYTVTYPAQKKEWRGGQVLYFLGVHQGILWALLFSGKIIGVAVETGTVVKEIALPAQFPAELPDFLKEETAKVRWSQWFHLAPEENKIIGGWLSYYFEVDLEAQKSNTKSNNFWGNLLSRQRKELPRVDYKMQYVNDQEYSADAPIRFAHSSTHFYFGDTLNGIVGALNRKTLKVDWTQKIYEKRRGHLKAIEYVNDRLFVSYVKGWGGVSRHLKIWARP